MSRWAFLARNQSSGPIRYGRARLFGDLSGGAVAALIALPYGLAMASLMGLPPVLGILTSIISAPFIAVLGKNPVLIGGASSTTAPFVAMAVQAHGLWGAGILGAASALLMILISLLKIGRQILRVPHAVISGFSCGIGGMVIISQLDTVLGLPGSAANATTSPITQLISVCYRLHDAHSHPLLLALTAVAVAAIASRISRLLPAPLLGALAAILLARILHFTQELKVGPLTHPAAAMASQPWTLLDLASFTPAALGMAFVVAINLLITARVVDHARGHHEQLTEEAADRELRAYGIANFFTALCAAPPSVGIPARSLAVVKCGGTTPLANIFHAIFLTAILCVGSSYVSEIPLAALAGVTLWIGLGLLNWHAWRRLGSMSRYDLAAFLLTFLSVLVVNSLLAVLLGCLLYLVRHLQKRLPTKAPVEEEMEAVNE